MSLVNIVLIVVGVGYILARRVVGDIVQVKSLLVLPVALTVIGAVQVAHGGALGASAIAFVVAGVVVSVLIGAARGATVYLGQRRGELWMRYRASTVGLWVLSVAVRGALLPVEIAVTHESASSATHALLLSLGLGVLAESAVVLFRAMQREGTVVWEKGGNGRPHTPAPVFDQARDRLQSGDGLRDVVGLARRDW